MAEVSRVSFRDGRLASRRAEEAACRRYQAAGWLESMVGPLGLSSQPSEQEFVSCLRSGLVLCNAINKIQPGAVQKVVANPAPGLNWEIQPLPAYQYFENIRNFLVAIEELKLPSFEASDLERDTLDAGSAAKIVDCVLALKCYFEWKECNDGSEVWKFVKSPAVAQSAGKIQLRFGSSDSLVSCRRLDLSESQQSGDNKDLSSKDAADSLVRMLCDCLLNTKNMDHHVLPSLFHGIQDPVQAFAKLMSSCLQEEQLTSTLRDLLLEGSSQMYPLKGTQVCKHCKLCMEKSGCNHLHRVEKHENELMELKTLLSRTKGDFIDLQSQFQDDLKMLGIQCQALSSAALGYQQAVKENKDLYNMLQELKGNIRVFCRIRPTFNIETKSSIDYVGLDGSLIVYDPLSPQSTRKSFQFNKVFGPITTQDEVYKETQSLVRSVMDGYNVCIFAYGQTGSGKTHTMCGSPGASSNIMGISHMALNDLFHISSAREDMKYEVRVQMVEVYNEQVRDLLAEEAMTTKLEIRNCSGNGGLSIPDASLRPVHSAGDVVNLMKLGERNRSCSSTAVNHRSSRSHSVLTVHIEGRDVVGSVIRSCIHLVDLAGSERVDKSEVTGDRLKEAQHINKSLSCLGDVIAALAQKNSHIPYRNSKLTQLLQNSLGGHAKMLMLAHVSPEAEFYGETVSTLKFAQRASTVELGAAYMNKESSNVRELKEEIDDLKKALARREREKALPSYRMKENTPILNKPNPNDCTPPRPRRFSIENGIVSKSTAAANPDDRKMLKSPMRRANQAEHTPPRPRRLSIESASVPKSGTTPRPGDNKKAPKSPVSKARFVTELASVRSRRLSLEGAKCETQQDNKVVEASILDEMPLKENILCSQVACVEGGKPAISFNCENSEVAPASEDVLFGSPMTCKSSYQSLQPNIWRRSGLPLQQPKTPVLSSKFDELVTPEKRGSTTKFQTASNTNSSSRGSHIRKSLQTIGKLIHGTDKRSNQCPFEKKTSLLGTTNAHDAKSLMTAETRSHRRQSLTNVHISGVNLTRRSSLGGKSTESYSTDRQSARTPPPSHPSSGKAMKRWL